MHKLTAIALALSIGCSASAKLKAGEKVFIDCAKADLHTVVDGKDLLTEVAKALADVSADWKAALTALSKAASYDAFACAVQAATAVLAVAAPAHALEVPLSVQRGRSYMADMGWHFRAE